MEIIVKPEKDHMQSLYSHHIQNFLFPIQDYSTEYNSYFTIEEIKEIQNQYSDINIYVSLNKNFFNNELEGLKQILQQLDKMNVVAVFFYDFAVLRLKNELQLNLPLVWNQTHMVANYKTCDYYYDNGVEYALLSKEITLEEMDEILKRSKITPIVELISKPVIAFSKRNLVTNFYHNLNKEFKSQIHVKEKISDTDLIVKETDHGTFFVKDSIVNGSLVLDHLLQNQFPYILLKEDYIDYSLFLEMIDQVSFYISHYNTLTDEEKEDWCQKQQELLGKDLSFFFQKTIYKVK